MIERVLELLAHWRAILLNVVTHSLPSSFTHRKLRLHLRPLGSGEQSWRGRTSSAESVVGLFQ